MPCGGGNGAFPGSIAAPVPRLPMDYNSDHPTVYNVGYISSARRQTGERTIDGPIEAKLDLAEYGPEGEEWVLLQLARR